MAVVTNALGVGLSMSTGGASLGIIPVNRKVRNIKEEAAGAAKALEEAQEKAVAESEFARQKQVKKSNTLVNMYRPVEGRQNNFGNSGRATLLGH